MADVPGPLDERSAHPTLVVQLPRAGDTVRMRVAKVVWAVAMGVAVVLAAGILVVEVGHDPHHGVGGHVVDLAHIVGAPFSGVFRFHALNAHGTLSVDEVRTHATNWALAMAAYLVVGRVLYRLILPMSR